MMIFPHLSFADLGLITWKGIYYQAVPNKKGITQEYCEEHSMGTCIHTIKDEFDMTTTGVKLDHSNFNIDKVNGVYLIYGDFLATKKSKNINWQDHIYYYAYKFSEAGVTRGIWYSNACKGLYEGIAIRNNNP